MRGLELAKAYYAECRPVLLETIPDIISNAAIGLVGEGSECFSCDDEASQDHDFGAAFCLWLPKDLLVKSKERIDAAFALLPDIYAGYKTRMKQTTGRVGMLAIEDFYKFFTGLNHPPVNFLEWLHIPEYQLAACTNGEVFEDNNGAFSSFREKLLAYYPRDVWLKKLAGHCMLAAQAGQYNLPRSLARNDRIAAMLSAAKFADSALSIVFILNKHYKPFYKWAGKIGRTLPVLGALLGNTLDNLAANPLRGAEDLPIVEYVEDFCKATASCLNNMGLSAEKDSWLWAHGPQIMRHVYDNDLRRMNLLQDC